MSEALRTRSRVAAWSELEDGAPAYALVAGVDLVVLEDRHRSVGLLAGRCLHRGVLLADGQVSGDRLVWRCARLEL